MGRTLESMNIHSPSIAEPPKSSTEATLNELLEEKIILEDTLSQLNIVLETHGVGKVLSCSELT